MGHFNDLLGHKREMEDAFLVEVLPLLPRHEDEVKERIEMSISAKEIESAIDGLQNGKALGPDALNADFYKTFKNTLSQLLHGVVSKAYEQKRVPPSFTTSHVVLMPKTDDPQNTTELCQRQADNICKPNVASSCDARGMSAHVAEIPHSVVSQRTCAALIRNDIILPPLSHGLRDCVQTSGYT